jgi:hypothetical protein
MQQSRCQLFWYAAIGAPESPTAAGQVHRTAKEALQELEEKDAVLEAQELVPDSNLWDALGGSCYRQPWGAPTVAASYGAARYFSWSRGWQNWRVLTDTVLVGQAVDLDPSSSKWALAMDSEELRSKCSKSQVNFSVDGHAPQASL